MDDEQKNFEWCREAEERLRKSQLEPGATAWREDAEAMVSSSERLFRRVDGAPVYVLDTDHRPYFDAGSEGGIQETGQSFLEQVRVLETCVAYSGILMGSPTFAGYIPGGGQPLAAWGDFFADVYNVYSGVEFFNPAAVAMERGVLRWIAESVGFAPPEDLAYGGVLTSGGSTATLTALTVAREDRGLLDSSLPPALVYLSEQAHHSVRKDLHILGIRADRIRVVPVDSQLCMDVAALQRMISEDRSCGFRVGAIVSAAGCTNVGAVDPLELIQDVADAEHAWHHIDAAYGGFFALDESLRVRKLGAGFSRCHSLTLDPHKALFMPYGVGAVLVRSRRAMFRAFRHEPPAYFRDGATSDEPECDSEVSWSPADLSLELSRPFRAVRLWLPLRVCGAALFRDCLSEKLRLARHAWYRIRAMPALKLLLPHSPPDLTVVPFFCAIRNPLGDEATVLAAENAATEVLVNALIRDGHVFFSSTIVRGRVVVRMALSVFRTHISHVETMLDILDKTSSSLF